MYITVAIADEHLAIRESTSSPLFLLYISLHTLQCTYRGIAYALMLCRSAKLLIFGAFKLQVLRIPILFTNTLPSLPYQLSTDNCTATITFVTRAIFHTRLRKTSTRSSNVFYTSQLYRNLPIVSSDTRRNYCRALLVPLALRSRFAILAALVISYVISAALPQPPLVRSPSAVFDHCVGEYLVARTLCTCTVQVVHINLSFVEAYFIIAKHSNVRVAKLKSLRLHIQTIYILTFSELLTQSIQTLNS